MSEPNPAMASTPRARNGSRYLFLLLLGLAVGVFATVVAMRALDQRKDHFPEAVMQVQARHMDDLKANVDSNRCGATDTLPHLQALRTMANDLEPAFPDLSDDKRFADHASKMRASLDAALASPPLNCPGVGKVLENVGGSCKSCHQDFRG